MSATRCRRSLPLRAALPLLLAALALALPPAAAEPRRIDQDFEFDDAPAPAAAPARRLVYDPDNPLCRALRCGRRERCALRDGRSAACVAEGAVRGEGRGADGAGRCVGCAGASRGFLCGSDNRTYSSLCRLDLHNCVRRAAPPVRLACRGFCPCGSRESRDPERRWRRPAAPAAGCARDAMADRLLAWFGVLMEQGGAGRGAGRGAAPRTGFPRGCRPEVRWMFAHLDAAGDGLLSPDDLYALRHDSRERCLRPFLAACGGAAGVSRAAWCGCLRRAARPCAALARAAPPGGYGPACDARGRYRARQCHAALGVCWCVDALGAERPGSRTRGAPRCPADPDDGPDDPDGGPDDDEDADGSGDDNELRF